MNPVLLRAFLDEREKIAMTKKQKRVALAGGAVAVPTLALGTLALRSRRLPGTKALGNLVESNARARSQIFRDLSANQSGLDKLRAGVDALAASGKRQDAMLSDLERRVVAVGKELNVEGPAWEALVRRVGGS